MLDFYVKTRIRFSLRDKELFEITKVKIMRIDCSYNFFYLQLYNTFYGLGLCLKEKDTQMLLATPDYSTHQVCWHLLKEGQEIRGSKPAKKDNTKGILWTETVSDIEDLTQVVIS